MDMIFALILMVIGMGVVYLFLYILVWVMRGLKYFERIPGFREPQLAVQAAAPVMKEAAPPASEDQAEGDDTEIVAAAVSAYVTLRDRGVGPAGDPRNEHEKVMK